MALSSTTIQQPLETIPSGTTVDNTGAASMLTALVIGIYAAQKSKRELRKLKRKALFTFFKYRLQASLSRQFKPKAAPQISNRTLLYILLGIAVLILLFISWPAAVVLLLLGILLVLLLK